MTPIRGRRLDKTEYLRSLRYELEMLARTRQRYVLSGPEKARYEVLCRQELDALGLT
jgi:hypothetical protein